MNDRPEILFLCGAKDFHAMDKFRLLSNAVGPTRVLLVTDTIEGEGQPSQKQPQDRVELLYLIDWLTPGYQSRWTHVWRNTLKFLLLPVQRRRMRQIYARYQPILVHAVPMYYIVLCWLAGIPFVGTPQAAEILERPKRSRFYRLMAVKALQAASRIAVDSVQMKATIERDFGRDAIVIKNGFKTSQALASQSAERRTRVMSMRGLQPNYRTLHILEARNASAAEIPLDIVFPFFDHSYLRRVEEAIGRHDVLHGRLEREVLYARMGEALLVLSIPDGDSSPRSVYEAIYCGAAVALAPAPFIEELPRCMRERICVVDLENPRWFAQAIAFAHEVVVHPYRPSAEALEMCDEDRTFRRVMRELYGVDADRLACT